MLACIFFFSFLPSISLFFYHLYIYDDDSYVFIFFVCDVYFFPPVFFISFSESFRITSMMMLVNGGKKTKSVKWKLKRKSYHHLDNKKKDYGLKTKDKPNLFIILCCLLVENIMGFFTFFSIFVIIIVIIIIFFGTEQNFFFSLAIINNRDNDNNNSNTSSSWLWNDNQRFFLSLSAINKWILAIFV